MQWHKSLIRFLFFGNYFYGICTVALSIEASIQQSYPLNNYWYYILLFAATVVYYTKAYIEVTTLDKNNKRSVWYLNHRHWMIVSQIILTIIIFIAAFFILKDIWKELLQIKWMEWIAILIFPIVAICYYGIESIHSKKYTLRNNGWLKPFSIGFVWSGTVTIYPVLFHCIEYNEAYGISLFGTLLFVKNFMYITVLCIMFDIKDYAADYNQQLKTFVVRVGLRKTIFYIIIPLCIIGFGTFLVYTISHHISLLRIVINAIPFILLITVAYSMHRRKSILYYLAIIDGLMLVKAICGIISFSLF